MAIAVTLRKNLEQHQMSRIGQIGCLFRDLDGRFSPVFSSLLQDRWSMLILAGVAAAQILLVFFGLDGWRCPIRASLGVPCPGCGLSSAMVLLIQGEWRVAILTHAFAPVFLIGLFGGAAVSLLRGRVHRETLNWITWIEQRTGFSTSVLLMLIAYWALRLCGLV